MDSLNHACNGNPVGFAKNQSMIETELRTQARKSRSHPFDGHDFDDTGSLASDNEIRKSRTMRRNNHLGRTDGGELFGKGHLFETQNLESFGAKLALEFLFIGKRPKFGSSSGNVDSSIGSRVGNSWNERGAKPDQIAWPDEACPREFRDEHTK